MQSLRSAMIVAVALTLPRPALAQSAAADSSFSRQISHGVTLRRVVRADGPVIMHVLEIDLRDPELMVRAVRACDRGTGRERPSAIVRRLRGEGLDVVGAINAGFFDLEGGTGTSESNVVVDGEIAKGIERTESPFDKFDNVHSQFAFTARRRPAIDRFRLTGTVRMPRGRWTLGALNGIPAANEVSLYTSWSDRPPRFPASMGSSAVPLELLRSSPAAGVARGAASGDTLRYRVLPLAGRDSSGDTTGTRALLVGTGSAAAGVARLQPGDIVAVVARFTPDRGRLAALVGGWPRIVREGSSIAAASDSLEGTFPRFGTARHPRSAVGFSRDSTTLFLVAVDGRQATSVGMSLAELAQAMIELGAYDALNLDGGGSTALVVGDTVVNHPSDATGERAVGDALIVTREAPGVARTDRQLPARKLVASCVTSGNRDPDRVTPAPAAAAPAVPAASTNSPPKP